MGHEIERVLIDRGHTVLITVDAGEEAKLATERLCPVGMRLFVASTKTIRKISIQFHSKAPMSPSSSPLPLRHSAMSRPVSGRECL